MSGKAKQRGAERAAGIACGTTPPAGQQSKASRSSPGIDDSCELHRMERIGVTESALFVMVEIARRNFVSAGQRESAVTAAFLSLAGIARVTPEIRAAIRKELAKC